MSALLRRRQPDYLYAAIQLLEVVDVLFGTLPAGRRFQAHVACDLADEVGAIGNFGAPDRRARLQVLDVGEDLLGVGFVEVDSIIRSQVLGIKIAVTGPGLRWHPR